jgi:hypothetical protein
MTIDTQKLKQEGFKPVSSGFGFTSNVGRRIFTKKHKGVEVTIAEEGDIYTWESTNYGSKEERANAIDHFHKIYHFYNWKSRDEE